MSHGKLIFLQPWRLFVAGVFLAFGAAGCATIAEYPSAPVRMSQEGVYHKVQKGETIWRIAKAYGVALDKIVTINNIPDGAHVDEGQLIFIPGAGEIRKVQAVSDSGSGQGGALVGKDDDYGWPIKGQVINYFGSRKGGFLNKGIWIQAEEGQTVLATRDGQVVFADYLTGYGKTVILAHRDGYLSVYAQNADLLVHLGENVHKGAPLGRVGRSGNRSFLHFEIRRNGRADNPLHFLPRT